MSKEWPYARLAKEASKVGGPEKLLALVKAEAFQMGKEASNKALIPVFFAGVGLTIVAVKLYPKISKWFTNNEEKRIKDHNEAIQAENILIEGLNGDSNNKESKSEDPIIICETIDEKKQ